MNSSIFVHFHEILIFLLTLNKKYDIIITENKERKIIMEKTTKIRLYSNEDNLNDTLAWLALTDEQLCLLDYLISNGYLTDGINYEECGDPEFKTIKRMTSIII